MMAALQGGLTFQKGLGAVHSMSHPLGGVKAPVLHHGTLNAVVLPAVLRFNASHVADKMYALETALNVPAVERPRHLHRVAECRDRLAARRCVRWASPTTCFRE